MIVPTCVTGSKVEDAAPSLRIYSVSTLEACSQLSDSDTLASGPAKSPVGQRIGLSSQSAMCGLVRVAYVAGMELHPSSESEPLPLINQ